ncbi:MAG: hypothetical protein K8E24_007345 [Methanobacterium paludis]|nr:hypothetical protein [Methanobacterium paludis]
MAKYSIESAVTISIVVGLILNFINLGGMFAIVVIGFIATYLTVPEKSSYKIGCIAAFSFGILKFLYGFLTPPTLPYDLSIYSAGLGLAASGFITLIFGFIVFALIYIILGAIGGLIVDFLFSKKTHKKKPKTKPRRSLNRV